MNEAATQQIIQQIVLATAVFFIAFSSAMARVVAFPPTKRGSGFVDKRFSSRVAFSATAGFVAMCWLGVIGLCVGNDWLSANSFPIACFSAGIGALGPEQQRLFLVALLEIGTRVTKPKDDDTK